MMRTIVLHGALADQFGGPFNLDVASPAEAVRALILQIKGLRQRLRQGHYRVIRKRNARQTDLGEHELSMRLGNAKELHIVPVIAGAGGTGRAIGKIVVGVALVAAAVFVPVLGATAFLGTTLAGVAGSVGLSLALSGVSTLLTKAPQTQSGNAAVDQRASFLFGGQLNVTTQGGPVPCVYGRFRVGSVLISAGLSVDQIGTAAAFFTPEQLLARAFAARKGAG